MEKNENAGMISLDNGLHFKAVDDLTADEVSFVIKDIYCHDSWNFPEIMGIVAELGNQLWETEREWLTEFMSRFGSEHNSEYIIG